MRPARKATFGTRTNPAAGAKAKGARGRTVDEARREREVPCPCARRETRGASTTPFPATRPLRLPVPRKAPRMPSLPPSSPCPQWAHAEWRVADEAQRAPRDEEWGCSPSGARSPPSNAAFADDKNAEGSAATNRQSRNSTLCPSRTYWMTLSRWRREESPLSFGSPSPKVCAQPLPRARLSPHFCPFGVLASLSPLSPPRRPLNLTSSIPKMAPIVSPCFSEVLQKTSQ